MRALSDNQHQILTSLEGIEPATARQVADAAHRSSDGAAYTLRSLVARGLVGHSAHDGEKYSYRLTDAGRQACRDHRQAEADAKEKFLGWLRQQRD